MPRVKAHFKSHLSLGNHAKTAEMFADNDLLATWLRLGHLAVERRAALTNDIFIVRDEELQGLTGKGRIDVARKLLERLADISPISVECSANIWTITWPKFAEKQGFRLKNVGPPSLTTDTKGKKVPTEPVSPEATATTDGDGETPTESPGSAENDDPPPVRPRTRVEIVRRQWPLCVAAAAEYGKRWGPKPPKNVEPKMVARLRENPTAAPDVLVRAIHGAVKFWRGNDDPDRMIASYLRPQTIYLASKFDGYVEAFNQPDVPATQRGQRSGTARDNTVRGAVERLGDRYGIGDEGATVDVRASGQRVPDE